MFKHLFYIAIVVVLSVMLTVGCDTLFEHSPYSAKVPNEMTDTRQLNKVKLSEVKSKIDDKSSFRFAVIADNHLYFNELAKVVNLINMDSSILFVIHVGDMADGGFIKEYETFHKIMGRLQKPYFTVIGNHDVLVRGREIYNQMFGSENYSFTFFNCKFVFFNNVVLELTPELPDFEWLENQLAQRDEYRHLFLISHVPPWDDTYTEELSNTFKQAITKAKVSLSIHGHHHHPNKIWENGIRYLVSGAPQMGVYRIVEVMGDEIKVHTIEL
jgi:3',5'-cyclic-AMP phosphodiesterase